MSILFGIRKSQDEVVPQAQLRNLGTPTLRYAPEGTSAVAVGCVGMGFQPYSTTSRSALDQQPRSDHLGNLVTFDGRLDNHISLGEALHFEDAVLTDSALVLAAYRQWNEECFRRFVGDWALVLWDARKMCLYLARDHAGTRSLYFREGKDLLVWATYLDTFFAEETTTVIDEVFVSAYLAGASRRDRTPYADIRAVPPAHVLIVSEGGLKLKCHWSSIVEDRIQYKTNEDYDAHFLHLFGQSVARRTTMGEPILAQLSGGIDSTSIVCMSDHLRRRVDPDNTLLDTVSYYDDTEPAWNEKPYFAITEAHRGRVGLHVDVSMRRRSFQPASSTAGDSVYRWPGFDSESWEFEKRLHEQLQPGGYRVLLSGHGGDEMLGGVPTPIPELSDKLAAGDLVGLFRGATRWCVKTRSPIFHMLADVLRSTCALYRTSQKDYGLLPSWMSLRMKALLKDLSSDTFDSAGLFSPCPSTIFAGRAWSAVVESLPGSYPEFISRYEYRYPYLDRDLVDFLLRVPRQQLVQPGRRRAMMRRALAGIVPKEVLERRRKAFIARQPFVVLENSTKAIRALFEDPIVAAHGWVNVKQLRQSVELVVSGRDTDAWSSLLRLAAIETFLRSGAALVPDPRLGRSIAGQGSLIESLSVSR